MFRRKFVLYHGIDKSWRFRCSKAIALQILDIAAGLCPHDTFLLIDTKDGNEYRRKGCIE
jgi:hypothetical protein